MKGKFWRSRDGKSRQDDAFGTSFLHSPKTDTWVDRELHTAMVARSSQPLLAPLSNFAFGQRVRKIMIDGRAVLEWNRTVEDGLLQADYWIDIRLGVPIQIRLKLGGTETIQQLNNIEERDPDPELFKIPEGFSVLKCKPTASTDRPQPSNRRVSCGGGR